jgi:hypothetical protein
LLLDEKEEIFCAQKEWLFGARTTRQSDGMRRLSALKLTLSTSETNLDSYFGMFYFSSCCFFTRTNPDFKIIPFLAKSDQIESGCVYANVEAGSSATSSIVMHNARRDPAQQQPLNHHPHSLATLCSGGGKHSFSGPSANDPTSIISATISKGREMLSVATGKGISVGIIKTTGRLNKSE